VTLGQPLGEQGFRSQQDVGKVRLRYQLQLSCSQPQPISITRAFSASSQYSPQYLLPSCGWQSQAG
jgi:hypothetical protein